jgi:endonuclease/exonuclease/phosphatase family metal-dependent hydrolase
MAAVASVLKELDPDILCLQEIKEPEALDRLAEAMPGHALQVVSEFRGVQEVAILSRLQADTAYMEKFAEAEASPPRGFAFAAFPFADGMLAVYTVHLKSNSGGIDETAPKREESARQLVLHADETVRVYGEKGLPCTVVLCGDFNHDPGRPDWAGDDTFRILLDAGFAWAGQGLPREETISWLSNGRYPDAAFDHFMVRPAEGVVVGRAETEKTDREVSDHRPLSIRIKAGD